MKTNTGISIDYFNMLGWFTVLTFERQMIKSLELLPLAEKGIKC